MSSTVFANKRILYLGILLSIVFSVPFLGLGGGSVGGGSGVIRFISLNANNATGTTVTVTQSNTLNDTMIVIGSSGDQTNPVKVLSVTDSFNDLFTQRVSIPCGTPPPACSGQTGGFDIWTGKASTTGTNSIKATWNASLIPGLLLQVANYANVLGIGNITSGTATVVSTSLSVSITTLKSGSWIFGTASSSPDGIPTNCNKFTTPTPSFIRRGENCSVTQNFGFGDTLIEDNATSLRNSFTLTYIATNTFALPIWVAALELVATDLEPQHQFINTGVFCLNTGDTCRVNSAIKVSGTSSNQNVILNKEYCTGITTGAITTTATSSIEATGTYSSQARNQTGPIVLVRLYQSTGALNTTFSPGKCATTSSIIGMSKVFYATTGSVLAFGINEYPVALSGSVSVIAGTYNAFYTITFQGCSPSCSGDLAFTNWGAVLHSTIMIMQLK